jgi:predicted nucleic acid-binding protein
MKTPDVNLLLYAVNADSPRQAEAADWLERAFAEPAGIGFAWVALLGFIRLATRQGIFTQPLPLEEALGVGR